MTNLKTTKRALLSSVIALLVCFTMLLGTTFAWFTDSVTSSGNIIQTGTLDVSLEYADTILGVDEQGWIDACAGAIFSYDKWEPGYTAVKYVKIENEGTLDLKFILNIIPNNAAEEVNLADVIEVYMVSGAVAVESDALTTDSGYFVGSLTSLMNENDGAAHGVLYADDADKAGNVYEIYTIALKMSTSAGNEYMGKSVGGGFSVQLLATQLASESDSLGNDYDADAEYPAIPDKWDGTADTSWYNDEDPVFALATAEQFAGMNQLIGEGVTFEGKTIKLSADLDMSNADWFTANENFMGTLDGQGHTISGLHYEDYVGDYGSRMGLFGHIENGTVKNLVMDSVSFQAYQSYGGIICGGAHGDCTFENITLNNCINEMYNRGSAGIVGLGYTDSNYTFTDINIDSSNRIGAYWGTPDASCGGLIGYYWIYGEDTGSISVKDSYFAQEMNCYNDVVANYQWYAYRLSGMLVGYVQTTGVEEETTYPVLDNLICENVTVEYGDWAEYYYCEMEKCGHPSYAEADEYKFTRLVKISSVDEIYEEKNDWNDDFVLLNGENATCYHVVRDADTREVSSFHSHTAAEDNTCIKLTFDQLYGGDKGVYGETAHDGVTVIYPDN